MSTTNDVLDFTTEGKPKLSSGLNVLTILTIIGSILALVSSVYNYFTAQKSYEDMLKMKDTPEMQKAPAFVKSMMSDEMIEVLHKAYLNRMPIMILSLLGAALCLYGALEMRKQKKNGYLIWLVGELMPLVAGLAFLGMGAYQGFGLVALVFPIIFIILYTIYRKDILY
ncbi:MAG TPA: hypothetical protein PKK69_10955 [Ferruginibacter sp.]|nr:hypothetical protein [Ferruginibacter sp.]